MKKWFLQTDSITEIVEFETQQDVEKYIKEKYGDIEFTLFEIGE